jgi:hypothetical protein
MKKGEKAVFAIIGLLAVVAVGRQMLWDRAGQPRDRGIPFYTAAPPDVVQAASELYRKYGCKSCHSLWTVRDKMQSVPAPMLDGIGSLRSEAWFYEYLSAPSPQAILPSRLKREYKMPSFAQLPEGERRLLANYLASLKVKDWYLEETKKSEYEKLTGKEYRK